MLGKSRLRIYKEDVVNPETNAPAVSIPISGYLTPPQIATAYNIPPGDGSGVKIGIISFGGGFLQSDLNSSFSNLQSSGLIPSTAKAPTIKKVLLDGASGMFGGNGSDENTVDIYCLGTIVPAADITIYIGNTWESSMNRAISDGCHIISISWATDESYGDFLSSIFQNAINSKISILVASGDNGSTFSGQTSLDIAYPSSSASVISVGGTKLILNQNNTRASESDDNRDSSFGSSWGGGGGVSTIIPLPSFQTGLHYTPITNGVVGSPTQLTMRGLPDIAAPMNTYVLYYNGNIAGYGGTSLATPLLAGMLARFQKLTGVQRSSVDWNNIFYANKNDFLDITVGTNDDVITNGYAGTVGWDAVTGLGPPDGTALYRIVRTGLTYPKMNNGLRRASSLAYPRINK